MNETITVVMKALINNRVMNDMVSNVARSVLAGSSIPEELEDMFTFEIITRPSGSKFVVVDFA